MATVKIVPAEDWEILRKYLSDSGVILIPEEAMSQFSEKDAAKIRDADETELEFYDFGGEADVWVDIVYSPYTCAAVALLESAEDEETNKGGEEK